MSSVPVILVAQAIPQPVESEFRLAFAWEQVSALLMVDRTSHLYPSLGYAARRATQRPARSNAILTVRPKTAANNRSLDTDMAGSCDIQPLPASLNLLLQARCLTLPCPKSRMQLEQRPASLRLVCTVRGSRSHPSFVSLCSIFVAGG